MTEVPHPQTEPMETASRGARCHNDACSDCCVSTIGVLAVLEDGRWHGGGSLDGIETDHVSWDQARASFSQTLGLLGNKKIGRGEKWEREGRG